MAINSDRITFNTYYVKCKGISIPNSVKVGDPDWTRKFDWMENLEHVYIGGGGTRSSN